MPVADSTKFRGFAIRPLPGRETDLDDSNKPRLHIKPLIFRVLSATFLGAGTSKREPYQRQKSYEDEATRSTGFSRGCGGADHRLRGAPGVCASLCHTASASPRLGGGGSTPAPSGTGRGHSRSPRPAICMDTGLVGLARRLGLGQGLLRGPAKTPRRLGGRPLGTAPGRVCLGRRTLAVAAGRGRWWTAAGPPAAECRRHPLPPSAEALGVTAFAQMTAS